jgi:hypothetical protein
MGPLLIMKLFGWFKKRPAKVQPPMADREPFRCGTPHLQMGGIILAQTGNVVEIIRGEKRADPSNP